MFADDYALIICIMCQQNMLTLLVWGVDVISIASHGSDGLSQTVSVRLFSALIQ